MIECIVLKTIETATKIKRKKRLKKFFHNYFLQFSFLLMGALLYVCSGFVLFKIYFKK